MRVRGVGFRVSGAGSSGRACFVAAALLFLSLGAPAALRAQISVTASVDRTQLALGESLVLTVAISGAQNVAAPDLGQLDGFQVRYQGPSTQVSIVNGQMSSSVSHRYWLVATREGVFTLGPFRVEHDGKKYATSPIRVSVGARAPAQPAVPGRTPSADRPWLTIVPSKEEAFVGERIPAAVKLYVGNVRVDDLQFPEIAGEGFTLDPLPQPAQRDEVVSGRRYRVLQFDTTLTPLRAGELQVGPATMGMSVLRGRRRGRLEEFFPDMFAVREPFEARGTAVGLTVRPLPEAGKPATFTGAVGQFDFTVEAKPLELTAGDPITVRMRIAGRGNLSTVQPPRVSVDDHFRDYEPQPLKSESEGEKVFEQVVIPKEPTIKQLPPVSFSFFDPAGGAYRTITRGPFPLNVRPAEVAREPQVLVSENAPTLERAPEKLGRDLVYIKDAPGALRIRRGEFYRKYWFIFLQALPPGTFVVFWLFVRRRDRLAADPRLVRFRQAGREVRDVLRTLGASGDDGAGFYDRLTSAMTAYLGAKLDLPPGAVGRERVLQRLSESGDVSEAGNDVRSFFDLVERVRYAPGASSQADRDSALRLARNIVGRLERRLGRGGRLLGALLLSALLALGSAYTPAGAADSAALPADANTVFYEGNAAYKAGRYAEAAALYERIVTSGLESGALYFNLGNAYFKNGQLGKAVLNYVRAERLSPRDPDLRANLGYARERAQEAGAEPPLWRRLAFPLSDRSTTGELTAAATVLWWLLWLALGVRLWRPGARPMWTRVTMAMAVAFVVVASNLMARSAELEWTTRAVVTRGEQAVRFEPSPDGTEYFKVGEGTLLEVTESRDGWLQVRRSDGRRGWIEASAVALE